MGKDMGDVLMCECDVYVQGRDIGVESEWRCLCSRLGYNFYWKIVRTGEIIIYLCVSVNGGVLLLIDMQPPTKTITTYLQFVFIPGSGYG